MNRHLTDDQFAECLSGETPSRATQDHLATCALCRAEMDVFFGAVGGFSEAALGWSKARQAEALPIIVPKAAKPFFGTGMSMFAPMSWALAALLLLAVGVPTALHREHAASHQADAALNVPDDSPAQIAQDNTLLQSVNAALGENDPSPFREYGIADPDRKNSSSRVESRNR